VNNITDIMSLKMKDPKNVNQLRPFVDNWNHVLDGIKKKPPEEMLQVLFYDKIKELPPLAQEIGMYDRAVEGDTEKTYKWLMDQCERLLTRRHLEANRNSIKNNLTQDGGKPPAAPGPKAKVKPKAQPKKRAQSEPRGRKRDKSGGSRRNKSSGSGSNDKTCRAWKKNGKCPRGNDCKYEHPPDKKGKSRSPSAAKKKCNNGPTCKYLKEGKCKFDHSGDGPAAPAPKKKNKKKKAKQNDEKSGK
jgi:hypothetical protein